MFNFSNFLFNLIHHSTVINLISIFFFWSKKRRKSLRKKLQSQVNEPYVEKNYDLIIKALKNKEKIRILFFAFDKALWPYDDVYSYFQGDDRLDAKIIVIPDQTIFEEERIAKLNTIYDAFTVKGFDVINSLQNGEYVPAPQADIVFFTSPYEVSLPQYSIETWHHVALTCYVPYGILQANIQDLQYNKRFHNLLWRYFCETEMHKRMSETYANNKGKRTFVTGYPKTDRLLDNSYIPANPWKNKNQDAKKIIWAPHHTLGNGIDFSCFLEYADLMKSIVEELGNKIQLAFKPHPNLKEKLYEQEGWGRQKTDEYYNFWKISGNTQLEEGEYIDLFLTSDAMLFDSVSFIAEYALLEKPMLFTLKSEQIGEKFNEFGVETFAQIPKGRSAEDVRHFLSAPEDEKFRSTLKKGSAISELLYKDNQKSSEKIYNHVVKELFQ